MWWTQSLEPHKLDGSSIVTLKDGECSLGDALTRKLDATAISLPVLKRYNEIAQDDKLAALIDKQRSPQGILLGDVKSLMYSLIFLRNQSLRINWRARCANYRRVFTQLHLAPRLILVRYILQSASFAMIQMAAERKGVCSTYLADRIKEGNAIDVFVTANKHFKVPANPDAPLIMVGPGTGIAPFRAFIEERQATGAKGKNWLIFGDQHYLTDFLYQTEWQNYLEQMAC